MSKIIEASLRALNLDWSRKVVIYGFEHVGYRDIARAFRNHQVSSLGRSQTLSCAIGTPGGFIHYMGKGIEPLQVGPRQNDHPCCCKTGLVHLFLHNLRCQQAKQPMVPLVFLIDVEHNPYPPPSLNSIFSRDLTHLLTHAELRRFAKLLFDQTIHPELKEIMTNTVKWVKVRPVSVDSSSSPDFVLEQIPSPFNPKDIDIFHECLREREATRSKRPDGYIKCDWRDQLEARRLKIKQESAK